MFSMKVQPLCMKYTVLGVTIGFSLSHICYLTLTLCCVFHKTGGNTIVEDIINVHEIVYFQKFIVEKSHSLRSLCVFHKLL